MEFPKYAFTVFIYLHKTEPELQLVGVLHMFDSLLTQKNVNTKNMLHL